MLINGRYYTPGADGCQEPLSSGWRYSYAVFFRKSEIALYDVGSQIEFERISFNTLSLIVNVPLSAKQKMTLQSVLPYLMVIAAFCIVASFCSAPIEITFFLHSGCIDLNAGIRQRW